VLDAACTSPWRLLRFPSSALIEKHELAIFRERRESRPENVMTEVQPSIYTEKRQCSADGRTRKNREFQTACPDHFLLEGWRLALILTK
jgi:hypothetical protein